MILVTGGTGYTGGFVARRLAREHKANIRFLVRPSSDVSRLPPGAEVFAGDLSHAEEVSGAFAGVQRVVHLAHVRYTKTLASCVGSNVRHVVIVSSLRRFSKVPSASVDEVVQWEECALQSGMPCTILRPSMIFGPGNDRNISRLAAHLQRFRCVPVFGTGRYLQQPVYVEDVVDAIAASVWRDPGNQYDLAGPRAMTYNELIDLVGAAVGVRPLKVHVPVFIVLAALRVAAGVGVELSLDREQVCRLQEDKDYSIAAARRDLGFAPLEFDAALARIYGSAVS